MNYALIVGINQYRQPGHDLHGCVPDALRMGNVLRDQYSATTTTLTNSLATRAEILRRLETLVMTLAPGETGLWHQSSHGSQVPCRENDELDGLDESVCCHDWPTGAITDDEVYALTRKLNPGARLVIIADSCHSGTMERGCTDPARNSQPRFRSPLVLVPDGPDNLVMRRMWQRTARGRQRGFWSWMGRLFGRSVDTTPTTPAGGGVVLMAACREDQTAADADMGATYGGAFTQTLLDSLEQNPEQTYRELMKDVAWRLRGLAFSQEPQLRGDEGLFDLPAFK